MNKKIALLLKVFLIIFSLTFTCYAYSQGIVKRSKSSHSSTRKKGDSKKNNKNPKRRQSTKRKSVPKDDNIFVTGTYKDVSYVDLGLPSGNKWAVMNLAAIDLSDPGYQFAWGSLVPGYFNDWAESPLNGLGTFSIKSNDNFDAAKDLLGGKWHIPDVDDFDELERYCNWNILDEDGEIFTIDDQPVVFVEGPNGNVLILPYAIIDTEDDGLVVINQYWSSTPNYDDSTEAIAFDIWEEFGIYYEDRNTQLFIRPVYK